MENNTLSINSLAVYDVIIIGGSYSGLAAAMALGRALKTVLVIDSSQPCNRQTPYSHNFLTHDGHTPMDIRTMALQQVAMYPTVQFLEDIATEGRQVAGGFEIWTGRGDRYTGKQLIFATGIKDQMPGIPGLAECWGISVLHCPYCHGYEVRQQPTGILGNGTMGFDMVRLIANWTSNLTLFTNGPGALTTEQAALVQRHGIAVIEQPIVAIEHANGHLHHLLMQDGTRDALTALYAPLPFVQHCTLPASLGCAINADGYITVDDFQETSVKGVYACGDNVSRARTLANAVAMGTATGMAISKKMILEEFSRRS